MEHAVDVLMSVWDKPVFQFIQGLILGAVVVCALWAITSAYRYSKEIKRLEAEAEAVRPDLVNITGSVEVGNGEQKTAL